MKTVMINLNDISESAGVLHSGTDERKKLKVTSMKELRKWVFGLIDDADPDTKIEVGGYMSNCIAIQIGMWLAGYSNVYYKNHTGFYWKMRT